MCPPPIATHTHTRLTALCPGLPRWAGTRKVKPIWILPQQETVSGSGISWAICKSAPCSREITTPAPHYSVFTGRMPFLPPNQQCQSTEGNTDCNNERQSSTKLSYSAIDNILTNLLPAGLHDFFRVLNDSNAMATVNKLLECSQMEYSLLGLSLAGYSPSFFNSQRTN